MNNLLFRRGFTLIELLVVIAVIALLVSILMPSLMHAKQQARVASCASNQRNTLSLLHMYGNDYNEWPTNERLEGTEADGAWHYRYRTRGGNATTWIYQLTGTTDAYSSGVYRCAESLPADNERIGNLPRNGQTWCWAARDGSGSGGSKDYSASKIRNGDRGWFIFLGPLRVYPAGNGSACSDWDTKYNAWELWGDNWGNSNAINPDSPIYHGRLDNYSSNTPNFFRRPLQNAVLLNCPTILRVDGGPYWWHEWRASHGNKPLTGRDKAVTLTPPADARNYGFIDGRVLYVRYNDVARTSWP